VLRFLVTNPISMLRHIHITAPAKVNLSLKVLNRREDGYHDIVTIFERIGLADEICIGRLDKGIKVSSSVPITRKAEDNLVYRAARAILDYSGSGEGVDIFIEKNIPLAGGLGGGSSDAAGALVGINRLLGLKLSKNELYDLGGRIGADVPFFLSGATFALGSGRGDIIRPIRGGKSFHHLLIWPGFSLSTKDVYDRFDELRGLTPRANSVAGSSHRGKVRDLTPPVNWAAGSSHRGKVRDLTNTGLGDKIYPAFILKRSVFKPDSILHNDLQEAAISVRPDIKDIIERLAEALETSCMISGSGPSVFCLLKGRKEALIARDTVLRSFLPRERKGWKIFVVRTLS